MMLALNISDIIAIIVIIIIIGLAIFYVIKAKNKGQKCIGCPYAKACTRNNKQSCSNKD